MKRALRLGLTAYLILLTAGLSLYMPNGYDGIGESKYRFFYLTSLFFGIALLVLHLIRFFYEQTMLTEAERSGLPRDRAVTALMTFAAVCQIVTYLFAFDKEVSLHGTEGWRDGLMTELLLLWFAYLLYRYGAMGGHSVYLLFAAPFLTIALAGSARLGVHPFLRFLAERLCIPYAVTEGEAFLTTVGNINWYSGYLTVFLVAVAAVYTGFRRPAWYARAACLLFYAAAVISALTQGSGSMLLTLLVSGVLLTLFAAADATAFVRRMTLLLMTGLIAEGIGFLRARTTFFPPYDESDPFVRLIEQHAGVLVIGVALLLIAMVRVMTMMGETQEMIFRPRLTRRVFGWSLLLLGLLCIGVTIVQMTVPQADSFGNGRGAIWRLGAEVYRTMSFPARLIGLGQDNFYSYAMTVDSVRTQLIALYGGMRLTNVHAELYTMLLQNGILGTLSYVALTGCVLLRACRTVFTAKDDTIRTTALAGVLVIAALNAHNLVSFRQILAVPFYYAALGLTAGACARHQAEDVTR